MMNYLRLRSSERVVFYGNYADNLPQVKINVPFLNGSLKMKKNALDAMQGDGTITYPKGSGSHGGYIYRRRNSSVGVSQDFQTRVHDKNGDGAWFIFNKRIIEDYHRGKIYVKSSSKKGTIMQIRLRA